MHAVLICLLLLLLLILCYVHSRFVSTYFSPVCQVHTGHSRTLIRWCQGWKKA